MHLLICLLSYSFEVLIKPNKKQQRNSFRNGGDKKKTTTKCKHNASVDDGSFLPLNYNSVMERNNSIKLTPFQSCVVRCHVCLHTRHKSKWTRIEPSRAKLTQYALN